jgi:O-acetylserine/cysteine efflux transporter
VVVTHDWVVMRRRDIGIALIVVIIWGVNFVAIDEGLTRLPPLLFVAARFTLTAFPAVFFVPRPGVGWRTVVAVGMFMCVGQFGLLFVGMSEGMPAGLSSVVMQSQALFTVTIAAVLLGERPRPRQLLGLAIAAGGLALIGVERGRDVPVRALLLLLAGAACWGAANVVIRAVRPARPFSLLVYSALVAPIPLMTLSLLIEGPHRDWTAAHRIDGTVVWSLGYVVVLATVGGFGAWYWLLSRYESSLIAPFGLLVPVSGLSSAWAILGERPTLVQLAGSLVAVAGVALVVVTRTQSRSRAGAVGRRPLPAGSRRVGVADGAEQRPQLASGEHGPPR